MNTEQLNENENIYKIKMHRWRIAFFGLVILLAGIIIGASTAFIFKQQFPQGPGPGPRPEHSADRMIKGLRHELNLSPQQSQQIEPIIREHFGRLEQIRKETQPIIEKEMRKMNDKILPLLNQKQQEMWMQMQKRLPIEPPMPPRPGKPKPEGRFDEPPPPPQERPDERRPE